MNWSPRANAILAVSAAAIITASIHFEMASRLTAAIIHTLPTTICNRVLLSPILPRSVRVDLAWKYQISPSVAEKLTYDVDPVVSRAAYRVVGNQEVISDRQVIRNALVRNEDDLRIIFMLIWLNSHGAQEFMPELMDLALKRRVDTKHTSGSIARQIIANQHGIRIFDENDDACPGALLRAREKEIARFKDSDLKETRCFLPWWESEGRKLAARPPNR